VRRLRAEATTAPLALAPGLSWGSRNAEVVLEDRVVFVPVVHNPQVEQVDDAAVVETFEFERWNTARLALRLRYLEGLTVAQTATRMSRTEGAVCLLCHRALKQLHTVLGSSTEFLGPERVSSAHRLRYLVRASARIA
jgi:DNA-directed RNA polymerase specialized sigma24 family protein